jgi:RNA polymerase sigma-70 factor (ECF subfamily)
MRKREQINDEQIEELVIEAQKGNTEAFGDLYDNFFDAIYRYVYFKIEERYTEDLVGTVFIKAWENIKRYKKTSGFKSWLFRIAHNTVIDHYRTHKEESELTENVADARVLHNPNIITEKKIISQFVRKAISRLDDKYRQIVILKFINELDNAEIAQILNTTEANVRTLQFRALKKLRTIIEDLEQTEDPKGVEVFEARKATL